MIKIKIFIKTNDVLIVGAFKNVFQRSSSKVRLPDACRVRKSSHVLSADLCRGRVRFYNKRETQYKNVVSYTMQIG